MGTPVTADRSSESLGRGPWCNRRRGGAFPVGAACPGQHGEFDTDLRSLMMQRVFACRCISRPVERRMVKP